MFFCTCLNTPKGYIEFGEFRLNNRLSQRLEKRI